MSQPFSKDVVTDGVPSREENLPFGILAGAVAALIGALIWLGIFVATGLHVGAVASLGVGALVGLAVRYVGRGTSMIFGIIGAVFTLLGSLAGEILTMVQLLTTPQHDFYSVLTTVDLTRMASLILDNTDPIMYLIYAIAIFGAYKLSIRKKRN